jgi:hypothetical protein
MGKLVLGEGAKSHPQDFAVEAVLALEVVVDSGLVDPCLGNNGADTSFFIAALGKQPLGGFEDTLAGDVRRSASLLFSPNLPDLLCATGSNSLKRRRKTHQDVTHLTRLKCFEVSLVHLPDKKLGRAYTVRGYLGFGEMQLCRGFRFESFFVVLYAICGNKPDAI